MFFYDIPIGFLNLISEWYDGSIPNEETQKNLFYSPLTNRKNKPVLEKAQVCFCIGKSVEYKIIYAIYAKRRFPYIYLENCKKKKSKGGWLFGSIWYNVY